MTIALEECRAEFPDAPTWDGCDAAIIGMAVRCGEAMTFTYDYGMLVKCFITPECDEGCAREWVDYNIVGAYIGPSTPFILYPLED